MYAAHDLPWDGELGLAKHLGDLGRLADHLPSGRRPTLRTRDAALPARLTALAELLDATAAATAGEPAAFAAAAMRGAAAHARGLSLRTS